MKAFLSHIQVNIDMENLPFYKGLMTFLGMQVILEFEEVIGYASGGESSIWFLKRPKEIANDYDGAGVNHIGIGVNSIKEVDEVISYIKGKGLQPLFDTPRHRPDFTQGKGTYYQVMFRSPDNLLFEVVYAKHE